MHDTVYFTLPVILLKLVWMAALRQLVFMYVVPLMTLIPSIVITL